MKPQTVWARPKTEIREVPIPDQPGKIKGRSKYAKECEKLLKFNVALEVHEDIYGPFRRGLQRYLLGKDLADKVKIRQHLNSKLRLMTVWLENK